MNPSNLENWNRGINVSVKAFFRLFFALWWGRETLLTFALPILRALPLVGWFGDWIIPGAMFAVLLFALPFMMKHIRYSDLLLYCGAVLVVLATMLVSPEHSAYIEPDLWRILGLAIPAYFLGLCYDHESMKKDIYYISAIAVVVSYAYQIYQLMLGRELAEDNMNAAYNILPSALFLLYWAMQNKKPWCWILLAVAIILVISYGTRGPIAILALYFASLLLMRIWRKKSAWRILWTIVLCLAVILLLTTNIMLEAALALQGIFEEIGFSTRIFDRFLEGTFAESAGRAGILEKITDAISEHYLLGLGFYGDRILLQVYPHNIALELWSQFGVFIGTGMLLAMLLLFWQALRQTGNDGNRNMIILMICMAGVKLLLSGSYAVEPYLFFLIGLCVFRMRNS